MGSTKFILIGSKHRLQLLGEALQNADPAFSFHWPHPPESLHRLGRTRVRSAVLARGYGSCLYPAVPHRAQFDDPLLFAEGGKTFDPVAVYGCVPSPTQL